MYKCLETYIIKQMTDGKKQRPIVMCFVNLVSIAMLSVGAEGHFSRLFADDSVV